MKKIHRRLLGAATLANFRHGRPLGVDGARAPLARVKASAAAVSCLLVALVCLSATCIEFSRAVAAHAAQSDRLREAQRSLLDARHAREQALAARALMSEAAASHLSLPEWAARRIDVSQSMSRASANTLLQQLETGGGQIFHAQELEISVAQGDGAGLFGTPSESSQAVALSAKGTLYFRTGSGS